MVATEFGRWVHGRRDRVSSESAGLRSGGQRRAPGLRREELASLAGISVDYITRLEQGRAVNPSSQVVEALARALRLSGEERSHLFRLAGLAAPGAGLVPGGITPSVQRLLDRFSGAPVAVFDARWTLLSSNAAFAALMGDPLGWSGYERNAVWRQFLGPAGRARLTDEPRRALESALVADLRDVAARYPSDQGIARLTEDLCRNSPCFAELWRSGVVGRHEAARKTIDHPEVGQLTLDCDILTVAGSDVRIMIYTAEPDTEDAARLELLAVIGAQALTQQGPD